MIKHVCVDVDGVLLQYDRWKGVLNFGEPIEGAVEFTHKLAKKYKVVIHTTRLDPVLNRDEVVKYLVDAFGKTPAQIHEEDVAFFLQLRLEEVLKRHGFHFDELRMKPAAVLYIDDRAWRCRPQENEVAFGEVLTQLCIE